MTIYNYRTGEEIRTATPAEEAMYMASIADDRTETGAVDGAPYGIDCSIYMA